MDKNLKAMALQTAVALIGPAGRDAIKNKPNIPQYYLDLAAVVEEYINGKPKTEPSGGQAALPLQGI